jgi:hypothetical protein
MGRRGESAQEGPPKLPSKVSRFWRQIKRFLSAILFTLTARRQAIYEMMMVRREGVHILRPELAVHDLRTLDPAGGIARIHDQLGVAHDAGEVVVGVVGDN